MKTSSNDSNEILTDAKTIARRMGLTHAYVKHLTRKRLIPVYSLGYRIQRYKVSEVEAALLRLRRPAKGERLAGGAR